jgi:hypothetical protein
MIAETLASTTSNSLVASSLIAETVPSSARLTSSPSGTVTRDGCSCGASGGKEDDKDDGEDEEDEEDEEEKGIEKDEDDEEEVDEEGGCLALRFLALLRRPDLRFSACAACASVEEPVQRLRLPATAKAAAGTSFAASAASESPPPHSSPPPPPPPGLGACPPSAR